MPGSSPAADICAPALQDVLACHFLTRLSALSLTLLRTASRAMKELVDGDCCQAWAQATAGLLHDAEAEDAQTGGQWQEALRHEWRSQQALRAGALHRVTKVDLGDQINNPISFWVPNPCPSMPSYLMSQLADGTLTLFNASLRQSQPVQLSRKPVGPFKAYMGREGRLHIVEISGTEASLPQEAPSLLWQTLDPATGQVLASELKHSWSISVSDLPQVHHACSQLALAMVDMHTVAVMDASSLEEKSRCSPDEQLLASMPSGEHVVQKVAWSRTGAMLAVAYHRCGKKRLAGAQVAVCVYDTSCGRCRQSQLLLCDSVDSLQWSASQDILAVHCWRENGLSPVPYGILLTSDGRPVMGPVLNGVPSRAHRKDCHALQQDWLDPAAEGFIILLDPALQQASQLNSSNVVPGGRELEQTRGGWCACRWSSCGQLLLAEWELLRLSGFCVIDPKSLEILYLQDEAAGRTIWATSSACTLAFKKVSQKTVSASFWGPASIVFFCKSPDGAWQGHEGYPSDDDDQSWPLHIAPDNKTLVGVDDPETGFGRRGFVQHRSSACGPGTFLTPELPIDNEILQLEWAPFPRTWPSICAYLHPPSSPLEPASVAVGKGPEMIRLVNCNDDVVLGSWTESMLSKLALAEDKASEAAKLLSVEWAPTAQHLAVRCAKHTFVLTFAS